MLYINGFKLFLSKSFSNYWMKQKIYSKGWRIKIKQFLKIIVELDIYACVEGNEDSFNSSFFRGDGCPNSRKCVHCAHHIPLQTVSPIIIIIIIIIISPIIII